MRFQPKVFCDSMIKQYTFRKRQLVHAFKSVTSFLQSYALEGQFTPFQVVYLSALQVAFPFWGELFQQISIYSPCRFLHMKSDSSGLV